MSRIVAALRKAKEQYECENIADLRHHQSMMQFLNQKTEKFSLKITLLICAFAVVVPLSGLMIFISDSEQENLSFKRVLTNQRDENNLRESIRKSFVVNEPLQNNLSDSKLSSSPCYTIQIGSFQNHKNAEAILGNLRKNGYSDVVISKILIAENTWYRVYVGEFQFKQQAQNELAKLQKDYTDSFVIKTQR